MIANSLALTRIHKSSAEPVLSFFTSVYEAVAKIIGIIMRFAPVAVACLLFTMTARFGFTFLMSLGWFVGTVLVGLGIHMIVVYSLSVKFLSRISPPEFFRRVKTVIVTAFSTSSSNATLPTALRVSEENLGVPRGINSFVLTVGATANQNGTAGVPSGSLPFIMVVLATVGINPELIAIIIGIDRILDMCRTTLNVVGDITAATYVARSEGAQLLPSGV